MKSRQLTFDKSLEAARAPGIDYAATGSKLRNVQMQLHVTALEWEEAATRLEELQRQQAEAEI